MIKVSAVSYLNTLPFVYGLRQKNPASMDLSLDIPSEVARKLIDGTADLGLVPVAVIPVLTDPQILPGFCIGADGPVQSVMLYGEVPVEEMTSVFLDYQSRTSVRLMKILAADHWRVSPEWIQAGPGFEKKIAGTVGGVVIGDRTFELNRKFPFVYDLSEAWKQMTGLPFVFAAWVATKKLSDNFVQEFTDALSFGVNNISAAVDSYKITHPSREEILNYLNASISYPFDEEKQKGLDLFLRLVREQKISLPQ